MLNLKIIGVIGCGLSLAASPLRAEEPLASVNGEPITRFMVEDQAARNMRSLYEKESAQKALEETITFELLAAEARKLGYANDPEIVKMVKDRIVQKLIVDQVDRQLRDASVSDEELRVYYDAHPSEFTRPSVAKGQMLMIVIREGQEEESQKKLNEALERLKKGEEFAAVVKDLSDDVSARVKGGASGWIAQGEPKKRYSQEVVDALFALEKDQVSAPIRTPHAWYVVKAVARQAERITPFDQAKQGIQRQLQMEKRQEAYNRYADGLKKEFAVEVKPDAAGRLVKDVKQQERPPMGPVPFEYKMSE